MKQQRYASSSVMACGHVRWTAAWCSAFSAPSMHAPEPSGTYSDATAGAGIEPLSRRTCTRATSSQQQRAGNLFCNVPP